MSRIVPSLQDIFKGLQYYQDVEGICKVSSDYVVPNDLEYKSFFRSKDKLDKIETNNQIDKQSDQLTENSVKLLDDEDCDSLTNPAITFRDEKALLPRIPLHSQSRNVRKFSQNPLSSEFSDFPFLLNNFLQGNINSLLILTDPKKLDLILNDLIHNPRISTTPITRQQDDNLCKRYTYKSNKLKHSFYVVHLDDIVKCPTYLEQLFSISFDNTFNLLKKLIPYNIDGFIRILDQFITFYKSWNPNLISSTSDNNISLKDFTNQCSEQQIKKLIAFFNHLKEDSILETQKNELLEFKTIYYILLSLLTIFHLGKMPCDNDIYDLKALSKNLSRIEINYVYLPFNVTEYQKIIKNANKDQEKFLYYLHKLNTEDRNYVINLYKSKNNIPGDDSIVISYAKYIKNSCIEQISHQKVFLIGSKPNLIIRDLGFKIRKFHCVVDINPIQGGKNIDYLIQNYQDLFEYANVLLHPDNQFFDFFHVWNKQIIKRNNVMMRLFNKSPNEPTGYVIMRNYPIMYNLLKQYCFNPKEKIQAFSLKGSPGTGKTIMFIYFILRWLQLHDLETDKHTKIDTIFIKPATCENILYFQFLKTQETGFRFGVIQQNYSKIKYKKSVKPILDIKFNGYSYEIIDKSSIEQINLLTKKINKQSIDPLNYNWDTCLYLFNEINHSLLNFNSRYMILNSIGSSYNNDKDEEIQIYTFLPKTDEMAMISSLMNKQNQIEFLKNYNLLHNNIRACIFKNFDDIYKSARIEVSNIHQDKYISALQDPETFLHKKTHLARKYLIHISSYTPNDGDLYKFMNEKYESYKYFLEYNVITPSTTITKLLRDRFLQQKQNFQNFFFRIIPDEYKFQSMRRTWFEADLHSFITDNQCPCSFVTYRIHSTINDDKTKSNHSSGKKLTIDINSFSQKIQCTSNLDELFFSSEPAVYFIPKESNHHGFDSAYRGKFPINNGVETKIILIQCTVSNVHQFHIGIYEYILKKMQTIKPKWKLEFWAVIPNIETNFCFRDIIGYDKTNTADLKQSMTNFERYYTSYAYKSVEAANTQFCTYTNDYIFRKAKPVF